MMDAHLLICGVCLFQKKKREQKFLLSVSLFETHSVHKPPGEMAAPSFKGKSAYFNIEKGSFCDLLFNGSSPKTLPYFKL